MQSEWHRYSCCRHDGVIKWKHFPRYWPFVCGSHWSPVNSPHKGQWRGALTLSLICALNKRLSKQSWNWRFETPSCSLWRHCNGKAENPWQWGYTADHVDHMSWCGIPIINTIWSCDRRGYSTTQASCCTTWGILQSKVCPRGHNVNLPWENVREETNGNAISYITLHKSGTGR